MKIFSPTAPSPGRTVPAAAQTGMCGSSSPPCGTPPVVGNREGVGASEPVHGVAAGSPLGQEVIKEGLHEGALRARQLLAGVVLLELVAQHGELLLGLSHPLDVLDVRQDGLPKGLVNLPDPGQLGLHVPMHV